MLNTEQLVGHPSSFRDPSGHIFVSDGVVYRRVNHCYRRAYEQLMSSGLYAQLVSDGLLISHEEIADHSLQLDSQNDDDAVHMVLKPAQVDFISYPYEWCFGQLKDAAVATLQIQQAAIKHGMSLKDG